MKITVAHPGILFCNIRVFGKSAHAGVAHTGVNAIGKMNLVYDALVELGERRARENLHRLFEKHSGRSCHLNIGTYRAGDWVSTVPGLAEIECRISHLPTEDPDEVRQQVEQVVQKAAGGDEWLRQNPPEVAWQEKYVIPWEQDPDNRFVQAFKSSANDTLQADFETIGVTWGLDTRLAPFFTMPALTFGPNGGNIHGVNEYVEIDSLLDCTKVLTAFIIDWCGVQNI
jgi:acetylornithine deacetylase